MKTLTTRISIFIKGVIVLCLSVFVFQAQAQLVTYTFTNAGATGATGPTQAQINAAYLATNLNGSVTVTGGIQSWTVPVSGAYRIEVNGAQGGGSTGGVNTGSVGGLGARMIGDFSLTAGQVIKILVGHLGGSAPYGGGGGGGSFVVDNINTPMIIAGAGGGGNGYVGYSRGVFAGGIGLITTGGGNSNQTVGAIGSPAPGAGGGAIAMGGTAGFGGGGAVASGGGGFYNIGGQGSNASPGQGFLQGGNGGAGNTATNFGGFGCGGGGQTSSGYGGGGGGYSGGGAGNWNGTTHGNGGGGGSYNVGTNQNNTAGINSGNGKVVITRLCSILLTAAGTNSNGAICSGQSVTITTDAISNYTWSTGSNAAFITDSPTITTTYTLAAMSPSNCMTSAAITVTVDPAVPNLTVANTATAASGVCPNSTVVLTASGATTYSWTGGISNGAVFTPTTATSYTVTGYNACGITTAVTSVSVHPYPPITAVISQPSVCTGNTVVTLASGAATYTWSHGAANGSFIYPSATTMYTVTGTSALGCTATAMVGVTVEVTPILAPVATPTVICIGGSGTITAQGASNYNWMPGNLNTGTIVITPNVTTTYTLTKSNSNCVDVKTITVYVNQLPNVFAITSHSVVCAGSSATLSGGGANSYTWTPSSFNLVGANVAVTPTAATIYTCTGSDGTCVATYTVFVGTNPVPTLQATASTPSICQGGSVTLTATGALAYTWTPGGTGASIVVTPAIPTSYQLVGENSFSCTSQIQQVVIVYPNPTVNAVPNRTLVCLNGPSTITATGANTYVWSTGALTHTTLVFPPATTVYTVTGTYTNSGCSSSKTVMVQAYTPVTGINGPTAVCIGSSITISSAPANSYTWTLGGNLLSNQASIVIGPTVNTTYMLGTTSTSNNVSCVGGNSVTIQVNPLPVVTASAIANRTLICKGESADLTAAGGVSYNWLFVGQGSMVTVSPQNHTTYTVQGTDANGCMNTATIQVRVSACIGINEINNSSIGLNIYPNPNNGEFNISSKEDVSLVLINELGQVVMELSLNAGNNHLVNVKGLSEGIYIISDKTNNTALHQKIIIQN